MNLDNEQIELEDRLKNIRVNDCCCLVYTVSSINSTYLPYIYLEIITKLVISREQWVNQKEL